MPEQSTDLVARHGPSHSLLPLSLELGENFEDIPQEHTAQAELSPLDLRALRIDDRCSPTASEPNAAPDPMTEQVSASLRVLAIPELLLLILSFVSPLTLAIPSSESSLPHEAEDPRSAIVHARASSLWTLVHTQRVSRTWRDLITSTQFLQQCLFTVPRTTSPASWIASRNSARPVLNPIVQTITHWRFSHLHPDQMGGRFSAHMVIERGDSYKNLLSLPATHRNMLLSQPPVTDLAMVIWERTTEPESGEARIRPPSSFYSVKQIKKDEGVTFGELLQRVGQMFEDSTIKAIKIWTA